MDLGLELNPRITGAAPKTVSWEVVRELTVEDLALLSMPRGSKVTPLKRLHARHHALAQHIAHGLPYEEAAAVLGYASGRAGYLMQDPSFLQLVKFYQENRDRDLQDNFARLVNLTADAADELMERMETEPEKVSTPQLMEIIKIGADRTGLGPASTSTNVNVSVGIAERLKKAREAARGPVIEGRVA